MEERGSAQQGFETIRKRFAAHQQDHVFRFWRQLDEAARRRLLAQAARVDLAALEGAWRARAEVDTAPPPTLEPAPVERLPSSSSESQARDRARARGEALLAEGRVAALVVAGGQATRLGSEAPKGCFPIGPVSQRSLFEIQAQKIRGVARRHGRPLPWYVMTSPATDAETRAAFEVANWFGLPPEDVVFFVQGTVPSLDLEGRMLLAAPDRISESPNGHGGTLTALVDSGALDDIEARGIDTLFYYQVDNPLVRMADPVYLGFHALAGAEMSCKVIRKKEPAEKMGVLARSGGRVAVVEYTELDDTHRFARGPDGELSYWAGNAAIHALAPSFVRRVAEDAEQLLPYHASAKKIPSLDAEGRPVAPERENGYKLERFVFDALPAARAVCVVEASRVEEYSPVKNAQGDDSPATARRDLQARYRAWLGAAGIEVAPGCSLELDHSRIDGPEDARALGARSLADLGDAVRVAEGGAA